MAGRPQRKNFAERRKLALHDFREQAIEAKSQLASIVLVANDDEEFEVPHPMLISDEAQKRLERVQSYQDLDRDEDGNIKEPLQVDGEPAEPLTIRTAKALLGDDHARFIAAGGHSNDITLAWEMLVEEQKSIMEADPK